MFLLRMAVVRCVVFLVVLNFLWSLARGDTEVSCIIMEVCILPCSFQGGTDAEIHWTTTTETFSSIHSYKNNQDLLTHQDQRFKGRTSLFKDQISRGNASLLLTGLVVQDQGRYSCNTRTISGNKESFINLRVDVSEKRDLALLSAQWKVVQINVTIALVAGLLLILYSMMRLIGQKENIQRKSNVACTQHQVSSHPGLRRRDSSRFPYSHSEPSLSQILSAKIKNCTRTESLPDVLLKDSFEEFSPDITVDKNKETYRFLCSRPGLYQCNETGLVFHMEGEGYFEDSYEELSRRDVDKDHQATIRPPAVEHRRTERGTREPCFSRAARMIGGAPSRICRVNPPSPPSRPSPSPRSRASPSPPTRHKPKSRKNWGSMVATIAGTCPRPQTQSMYAALSVRERGYCGSLGTIRERKRERETVISHTSPTLVPVLTHTHTPQKVIKLEQGQSISEDESPSFPTCSSVLIHSEPPVMTATASATNTLPAHPHLQLSRKISSHLLRSHSLPSLSKIDCAKNNFTRAESLPDMLLKDSFEEFCPDITVDENEETYRFLCSRPGLYQCSETGLVFHMEGEGEVVYRIVPWNRRLLAKLHKKPAGPLFDIKCLQQSVRQLHLPHCEIRSTGGCEFLSVAHVEDEDMDLITPHRITETHVIINITGFSDIGIMKDEDSPPVPVQALVLLFYRTLIGPDPESQLNVFLLPKNVVVRDVQRMWINGEYGSYIGTVPHCKLRPKQEYTLSTSLEDHSVLVQPTEAEFDEDYDVNYFPSFQLDLKRSMTNIKLFLKDKNSSLSVWETMKKHFFRGSSHSVWERRVSLLSTGVRNHFGPSALTLSSKKRLKNIRTGLIEGISGPVLKSLLDKLLEENVIIEAEMGSADVILNKREKARFVIDTVRNKGEAASSKMIEFLCEDDRFLCEHLGLM